MRSIIVIALILTALNLQSQVVPNATNADNLGGTSATDYVTLSGADDKYLPKASTGPVIDSNLAEITQIKIDTTTERTARIATDELIAEATKQNKVEIDDNKAVIEELSSVTKLFYYTNKQSPSGEYLLMIDTPTTAAESTVTSTLDSATVVVTSFTIGTPLNISAFKAGLYHSHFHAKVDNATKETRLRTEVYKGTGTALTFLFSTVQSNLMTTNKTYYDVHTSTVEIPGDVGLFTVRIVADTIGGGPDPVLTFYMEGDNSSVFEMPAIGAEVSVTKIIPGLNTTASPPSGRGDVVVGVDTMTFILESLQFNSEPSEQSYSEGLLFYDNAEKALTYYNEEADVALQIGREQWARVRNESGETISDGKVVYFLGATGQIPKIEEALANDPNTCRVIGVATHDIENNSFGYVTTYGIVRNIDTSTGGLSDGDIVYVSPTSTGSFTKTKPSDPDCAVVVGYIAYAHGSNGKLFVRPSDPLGISDILNLQTRLDLIRDTTQQNKVEIDQNVTDIATIAESTGTVPKPVTFVVGFTKDCDYICDGTSDYVEAQQAVIAAGGGTTLFRKGIYDMDKGSGYNIETTSINTVFMGEGDGTIFQGFGGGDVVGLLHSGCKLMNIQIQTGDDSIKNLIEVTASSCVIANCLSKTLHDTGIATVNVTAGGDNVQIINSKIEVTAGSNGSCLNIQGDNMIISENIIFARHIGIFVIDGTDSMIKDNRIVATGGSGDTPVGIQIHVNATRWMISGNDLTGCEIDITDNSTSTRIRNNKDKDGEWLPETSDRDMGENNLDNVYQISVDSITSNNKDFINIMANTTHYGNQWGRGHDSKGWDNSSANSFTVKDEYTLPTADGNANDVMSTDGAHTVTWGAGTPGPAGPGAKELINFYIPGDAFITTGIAYFGPLGYQVTLSSAMATVTADGTYPNGAGALNFNIMISSGIAQSTFETIMNSTYSLQMSSGTCWVETTDFRDAVLKANYMLRLDIGEVCGTYPGGDPICVSLYGKQE